MTQDLFSDKKVLITGGLGFIGSNLAHRLVGLGSQVTLVDSLNPEYGGNLFNISGIENQVRVNISDVGDKHSMRHLVQGQDYLFNLAGQTSHMDSMEDPFTDLEINCRSQISVLEACRRCNPNIKVVFASTRQVYGMPDAVPVNEDHPLRPVDINGVNKMAGEWYHVVYNNAFDIATCALRLTNTYGPRMRVKDTRQTFLGIWMRLLLEGKPFEVWEGHQLRDFTYVDDAVEALLLAASSDLSNGKTWNLGGDGVISLRELAEELVQLHGRGDYTLRPYPADRKRIDIGDYYADYSRIRETLGWKPQVALRDGLVRTLEYYRRNLHRYV